MKLKITRFTQTTLDFKLKRLDTMNKDRYIFQYKSGDLFNIISLLTNYIRTSSRQLAIRCLGSLVICKIIGIHNFLLMTLDGKILRELFENERLKPAIIRTSQQNVFNLP